MSARLQVAVTEGIACIKVGGPANFAAGVDFKTVVNQSCEQGGRVLLLDLTDCVNMDSTFLGILMSMTNRLDRIELLNPSERIIDLLDSLGVMELLTVGTGENPFDAKLQNTESTYADKRALTEASLEAHKLLMEINPDNVPRFKDVAKFLEEDLNK
ncbi:MAG: STAS domain-containing protein [Verrucomicrobiota bacterium]|nr:STAS domain-containing protein [Verrucomicrobiota bacterium]